MKEFRFHRPADLADAVARLKASSDARYLAGGQTLLPAMKLGLSEPEDLIDLTRLAALQGVAVEGTAMRIGAAVTHAEVANSAVVRSRIPVLASLARLIGDPSVRTRGTLGGSLANNDPAADYPAAALGLGATIHTDRRTIAADAFFLGLYQTALAADEIITAVSFPLPQAAGWAKFKQPASRYSLVGVFASRDAGGAVRVAVTGAGPCVFRAAALEAALATRWAPDACDGIAIDPAGLLEDLHASREYRAHLVAVMARRAVAEAG